MLIQFHFKNFKSFKDDSILDFSAAKIQDLSESVVTAGGEKLLPAAAVYGANASGKSNVIAALRFMTYYVYNSFSFGDTNQERKLRLAAPKITPFLFSAASRQEPSLFEVYYIEKENKTFRTYNYGFTIDENGVAEEWLNQVLRFGGDVKEIFYRERGSELSMPGLTEHQRELVRLSLNDETLIVSLGAKLRISRLKKVYDWFEGIHIANFGNATENLAYAHVIPRGFTSEKKVQDDVVRFLSSFDPSIVGFRVEKQSQDADYGESYKIYTIHNTEDGGKIELPLNEESGGTLNMFALYPFLQETLESGGILVVDELNARLHPLLVRNLVISFTNPSVNVNHAQFIFTTQDVWQLSDGSLRRDEIWFTEKNNAGESSLYSLMDIVNADGQHIRGDENLTRNYMLGKYGAIPELTDNICAAMTHTSNSKA